MAIHSFSMRREVDSLYEALYDISLTQAHAEEVCVVCKTPVDPAKMASPESVEEYRVFGKCFRCYSKEAAQNSLASHEIYEDN